MKTINVTTGTYIGGPMYNNNPMTSGDVVSNLQSSGFQEITVSAFGMEPNGDVIFQNLPHSHVKLIVGAQWQDTPGNATFLTNLNIISQSPGITKMSLMLSDQGLNTFESIYGLMYPNGTPTDPEIYPGDQLYENFSILKSKTPILNVNFDYEGTGWTTAGHNVAPWGSDVVTMLVNFGQMLNSLGFGVSYCPPFSSYTFWNQCYAESNQVQTNTGGNTPYPAFEVNGYYIQTYGGAVVSGWVQNLPSGQPATFIKAGVKAYNCKAQAFSCPSDVQSFLASNQQYGIDTGWLWLYDSIVKCQGRTGCNGQAGGDGSAYVQAIKAGLGTAQKPIGKPSTKPLEF